MNLKELVNAQPQPPQYQSYQSYQHSQRLPLQLERPSIHSNVKTKISLPPITDIVSRESLSALPPPPPPSALGASRSPYYGVNSASPSNYKYYQYDRQLPQPVMLPPQPLQPYHSHSYQSVTPPPSQLKPHISEVKAITPEATPPREHDSGVSRTMSDSMISKESLKRKTRNNLPKETTNILLKWLNEHLNHPYPNSYEKNQLMVSTGLNSQQLSNWFINARRRKIKGLKEQRSLNS